MQADRVFMVVEDRPNRRIRLSVSQPSTTINGYESALLWSTIRFVISLRYFFFSCSFPSHHVLISLCKQDYRYLKYGLFLFFEFDTLFLRFLNVRFYNLKT